MKLLLLNTCGTEGSIALADSGLPAPIIVEQKMPGRMASERVVAVVREALAGAGWKLRELNAVGVVTGPGSFTGVRVGLSVAKGLGEASGVGLIAVSRLALLAGAGVAATSGEICALLDAGRGELYCGEYLSAACMGEALLSRQDVVRVCSRAAAVMVCEEAVLESLGDVSLVQMISEPTAADAFPLALERLASGSFDDPMTLDANYLRRTDAEIFAKPAVRSGG